MNTALDTYRRAFSFHVWGNCLSRALTMGSTFPGYLSGSTVDGAIRGAVGHAREALYRASYRVRM